MIIPVPAPLPQKPSIPGAVYFFCLEGGSEAVVFEACGVNFQASGEVYCWEMGASNGFPYFWVAVFSLFG